MRRGGQGLSHSTAQRRHLQGNLRIGDLIGVNMRDVTRRRWTNRARRFARAPNLEDSANEIPRAPNGH